MLTVGDNINRRIQALLSSNDVRNGEGGMKDDAKSIMTDAIGQVQARLR
jgi:hypothetical protein